MFLVSLSTAKVVDSLGLLLKQNVKQHSVPVWPFPKVLSSLYGPTYCAVLLPFPDIIPVYYGTTVDISATDTGSLWFACLWSSGAAPSMYR